MKIKSVNHVCLVVKDRLASEAFFCGVLGLKRHHEIKSWFVIDASSTLHLVEIPEAESDDTAYHDVQHVAFQVENLTEAYHVLLRNELQPFQMNFNGEEHHLTDADDPLDFGLGSVFARDPDGNLVEFLEEGRGLFQVSMRPRVD